MSNPIKLKKATLFDCTKEFNIEGKEVKVANPIGGIFTLDPLPSDLEPFHSIIGRNIMSKLGAKESESLSKKHTKVSAITNVLPSEKTKGREPIAVNFNVEDDSPLEDLLNHTSNKEFQQKTRTLANRYVEYSDNPKGILGFVFFELKVNGRTENFIAILITDYREGLSSDPSSAIRLLNNVFDSKFKTIIFFPYLVEVGARLISVSEGNVKAYTKTTKTDPNLLKIIKVTPKIHPNDKLKKEYNKKLGKVSKFEDLVKELGDEAKDAEIALSLDGKKVKIPLIEFIKKFKIIYSAGGEGIFIENGNIKVLIGDKEVRQDWLTKMTIVLEKKKQYEKEKKD